MVNLRGNSDLVWPSLQRSHYPGIASNTQTGGQRDLWRKRDDEFNVFVDLRLAFVFEEKEHPTCAYIACEPRKFITLASDSQRNPHREPLGCATFIHVLDYTPFSQNDSETHSVDRVGIPGAYPLQSICTFVAYTWSENT